MYSNNQYSITNAVIIPKKKNTQEERSNKISLRHHLLTYVLTRRIGDIYIYIYPSKASSGIARSEDISDPLPPPSRKREIERIKKNTLT